MRVSLKFEARYTDSEKKDNEKKLAKELVIVYGEGAARKREEGGKPSLAIREKLGGGGRKSVNFM